MVFGVLGLSAMCALESSEMMSSMDVVPTRSFIPKLDAYWVTKQNESFAQGLGNYPKFFQNHGGNVPTVRLLFSQHALIRKTSRGTISIKPSSVERRHDSRHSQCNNPREHCC